MHPVDLAAVYNKGNLRGGFSMNKATSIDDLEARLKSIIGLPFANTIAAGRDGKAMYADLSTVPNVTGAKFQACTASQLLQGLAVAGLAALDGSTAACEWGNDVDSPQAGILGGGNLPVLINDTYSTNSNDSYWLSNPNTPLNGEFSPLLRRNLVPRNDVTVATGPSSSKVTVYM